MTVDIVRLLSGNKPLFDDYLIKETNKQISVSAEISELQLSLLKKLLVVSEDTPSIFGYFHVKLHHSDSRPDQNLISQSATGIEIGIHDEKSISDSAAPDWFSEFRKTTSFFIEEAEFEKLAQELLDRDSAIEESLSIEFRLKKNEMESFISEKLAIDSDYRIAYWTNGYRLKKWISDISEGQKFTTYFGARHPIFVFSEIKEKKPNSVIPLIHIEDEITTLEPLEEKTKQYQKNRENFSEIVDTSLKTTPVSPSFFDSSIHRDIFNAPFIYGILTALTDQVSISGNIINVEISSRKGKLEDEIDLCDGNSFTKYELTNLFQFYQKFSERADREIYRSMWNRAIIEHCQDIKSIAENREDIFHFYQSLEEEAIKGNFDDLSNAVQDAQIFIGDVTNTISNSTINLTSEIQKIVFALFGIIAVNLFLIFRESSLDTVAPFTISIVSGLLLFYFPTAQERINELNEIIQEGQKDADVYSEIIESVGGEEFFELERLQERQADYIELAENRTEWATERLRLAFLLLSTVWAVFAITALSFYSVDSIPYVSALLTLGPAIWIRQRHYKKEYYPRKPINQSLLEPINVIIVLIVVFALIGAMTGWRIPTSGLAGNA